MGWMISSPICCGERVAPRQEGGTTMQASKRELRRVQRSSSGRTTMYLEFILVTVGSRLIEFLLIFLGFLLSSLLPLTVIHTVDMGLREEELTLRNLMLVIRTKLKGIMVTKLYINFLSLGYLCFSLWLILVVHLVGGLSKTSQFIGYLMAILSFLLYVYLEFVWSQGVVVSTVERGQTGLIDVGRSADVVQGRGALAFGVNFLVILVTGGVAFLYSYAVKSLQWEATGSLFFPVADFVFCDITIFMEVFTLAVYTEFYRECSSNMADELALQEYLIYNGVPSAASFNSLLGHPPMFVIRTTITEESMMAVDDEWHLFCFALC